jgi:hypothetical protein
MSTDDTPEQAVQRPPVSILRRYEFGEISVLANWAAYIHGNPAHLYTFGARDIELTNYEFSGPQSHPADSDWSELLAFYSKDEPVIIHFLEALYRVQPDQYAAQFSIVELHEMCHWAAPDEDNPSADDTDHWESWNRCLADEIAYVMDVDEWRVEEYDPPDHSATKATQTKQTTLPGVQ